MSSNDSAGGPEQATNRLPVTTYLGYGVGQIGGQILRDTPAFILPLYMSVIIGLNPFLQGLVILIAKTYAVFADPAVGILSDRANTKWGRRRPFILAGGLLAAVSFFVLFIGPSTGSQIVIFLYMTIVYLILNTGFSMFSVPYLSMATEMSADPNERTTILSFRNAALAIGLVIAVGGSLQVVNFAMSTFGATPKGAYGWMGLILGLVIVASTLSVFFGTAKAPSLKSSEEKLPLKDQIRVAWENRPFRWLISANIIQYISAGIGYTGSPIFFAYALGLEDRVLTVATVWIIYMAATSVVSMPFFVWASAKFGKMSVYTWCLVMFAVTTPVYFLADQDTLWPVWAAAVFIGFFNGGFILMSFSVLTDTVAYDRAMSGQSREGALSAVYSAVDKACNALGAVIFTTFLGLIGFVTTNDGSFAQQTEEVLSGITYFFILAPAFLHLLSILVLRKYDLTKEKLEELTANAEATAPVE